MTDGIGIYVHWPFCQSKCPYCDFNSHVVNHVDQARWRRALVRDLEFEAAETGPRRVRSIFFGGGTPSLMPPATVHAVIETIRSLWDLSGEVEITLEANPTSVEAGRFRAFSQAGINRVSLGVQALNDRDLTALGRLHTAAEAVAAFDIARRYFDRISFDLIYARQGQDRADWRRELNEALAMAVDHLSLYQLTIEAGTRFGDLQARGKLRNLPSDDLAADLYAETQEICADAGLPGYEISNHARPGAESLHNLNYWRYGDYVGVGPGAHGRLSLAEGRVGTEALRVPEAWIAAVETKGSGRISSRIISRIDQATEFLLMGLRLSDGVNINKYQLLSGFSLDGRVISQLSEEGFVSLEQDCLRATKSGKLVLNAVLERLLV